MATYSSRLDHAGNSVRGQEAIKAGDEAAKVTVRGARAAGLPPTAVAAKAGEAALEAAKTKVAAFDVPVLSAEESNAVGSLSPELGRSYDQLRQCPIAELSAMERSKMGV